MSVRHRIVRFDVFVGTNGSGKSHAMRKWLRLNTRNLILPASRADAQWRGLPELRTKVQFQTDERDPNGKRRLPIYTVPGIGKFDGNHVLYIEGDDAKREAMFKAVLHPQWGFHNGGIFIDDSKNFIRTKGSLPGDVRTFWGNRRLHMVDIFMAAWQYQDINADFYGFDPQLYIFRVEREPNPAVLEKFSDPNELITVHRWVQRVNDHLPRGYQWYYMAYPFVGNIRPGKDPRAVARAFAAKYLPPSVRPK